jgi:hypothetical protein
MPIYEYYSPDNNRIYQFYAKTLAQGRTVPKCPDNPAHRMVKMLSSFAVVGGRSEEPAPPEAGAAGDGPGGDPGDARMEAAMSAMEGEFASVDENDPRAMGRMMRRMAELTGERMDGEMEEVVRKLEEGADPESLEDQFGTDPAPAEAGAAAGPEPGEGEPAGDGPRAPPQDGPVPRGRPRVRRSPPTRDPRLHDYDP